MDLVQIQCIDHLKVPNARPRPMLRMLSRLAEKRLPSTIKPKEAQYKLGPIGKAKTLAAASIVLILSALCLLLCLIGKVYHERHKAKIEAETISRKSSQVSTDTVITRL